MNEGAFLKYSVFSASNPIFDSYEIVKQDRNTLERYYEVPVYATSRRNFIHACLNPRGGGGLVTTMLLRVDRSTDRQFWERRGLALVCMVDH